jgi:hypothetical protein
MLKCVVSRGWRQARLSARGTVIWLEADAQVQSIEFAPRFAECQSSIGCLPTPRKCVVVAGPERSSWILRLAVAGTSATHAALAIGDGLAAMRRVTSIEIGRAQPLEISASSRPLSRNLWLRRKGRDVRRIPLSLKAGCKRLRVQNRPMLSNTSCAALLSPGSSPAASVSFPP